MSVIAEYIWLDGNGIIRSKTRTCNILIDEASNPVNYKNWSYDGSSTGDAVGSDSEIIINPVAVYRDPFRSGPTCFLVLCDTYLPDGRPTDFNTRLHASNIFLQYKDQKPWYGIEQEFFIMDGSQQPTSGYRSNNSKTPIGTKLDGIDMEIPQGQYYCSVGYQNAFGRRITEQAYGLSLASGVKCSGLNAEVAPGQWEIQVGPCEGISAADDLIILRYILQRVGENHGVQISLHPKPLQGDWNGSGCHTNFSTQLMRDNNGYKHIIDAIEKLKNKHGEHMDVYGKDNQLRCSGKHETADYNTFSYGVANRGSSIRIPIETQKKQCGYFEDRRPASNMDPYVVTSKILETILG